MTFRFYRLRFVFTALDEVIFPAGKPGNILRGALGTHFRKIVCDPGCPGARTCERRNECPYARIFEPSTTGPGPSGLADWPRPFVFRAGHLDGTCASAGSAFHFDLHLFTLDPEAIGHLTTAFAELAREGLGPRRGKARLESVEQLGLSGRVAAPPFTRAEGQPVLPEPPVTFDLTPGRAVTRLRVRFVMPTELKAGKTLVREPEFQILFNRCRDRISTLRALYQEGPLEVDFRDLGRRASLIRMTRCEIEWRDVMRRSSRTGQTHPIGGFVGMAEYRGEMRELYPFLNAAQWTGVGRHTVWGKGTIEVEALGGTPDRVVISSAP